MDNYGIVSGKALALFKLEEETEMQFLRRTVRFVYGGLFLYILITLTFFSHLDYSQKISMLLPDWCSVLIIAAFFIIFRYRLKVKAGKTRQHSHKTDVGISEHQYYIGLFVSAAVFFFIQLLIQRCAHFETGWDAGLIMKNADYFLKNHKLRDIPYMTRYPNNLMITFIIVILKKLSLFIGLKGNAFLLSCNALLVNLSCIFLSLAIKNRTGHHECAILAWFICVPLIIFSPWILIVYTDTFSILFPAAVYFLYTRNNKTKLDFFLIVCLSFVGYTIKPTAIITLMAIMITQFLFFDFSKVKHMDFNMLLVGGKTFIQFTGLFLLAAFLPMLLRAEAARYLHFIPQEDVREFTMTHYLMMGQNDETDGVYSDKDVAFSKTHKTKDELRIFKRRLLKRNLGEQLTFFARKILINFDSGTFAWGGEGTFYVYIPPSEGRAMDFVRNIFYPDGKYYRYWQQAMQLIWLMILFSAPGLIKKELDRGGTALLLALIGIILFVSLFEARGRYLYCYAPLFVAAAVAGIPACKVFSQV